MRARLALFAAATAALCIVAAACSVVDDGKVNRIDPPDELVDTLPSTSTSTTVLETTTTGEETTTSILQTELVRLYFITSGQLTYVNQSLPSPVALPLIIFALQQGPPTGEIGPGCARRSPAMCRSPYAPTIRASPASTCPTGSSTTSRSAISDS